MDPRPPAGDDASPVLRRIDSTTFEVSDCDATVRWLQRLGYHLVPTSGGEMARLHLQGATAIVQDDRVVRLVFDRERKAA